MIPESIDCQNKEIYMCDFYMHKDCLETCAYAKDVKPIGVGAICDPKLFSRLEREANNE